MITRARISSEAMSDVLDIPVKTIEFLIENPVSAVSYPDEIFEEMGNLRTAWGIRFLHKLLDDLEIETRYGDLRTQIQRDLFVLKEYQMKFEFTEEWNDTDKMINQWIEQKCSPTCSFDVSNVVYGRPGSS